MKKTDCPVCDAVIELDENTVAGELVECPDCGTELEVVTVNPLRVREAPQEEEDWGQ
ncbi:MAG: lysine biosynthesis protein LysW [Melioribacteraceae bacterium]|nr:lysine biosynthesis protein LysW [Melioribacteraceae bacterium]